MGSQADFWDLLQQFFAVTCGTFVGLIVGLLAYIVWSTCIYPWAVLLVKRMAQGQTAEEPVYIDGSKEIASGNVWALVLSDVHVDTWEESIIRDRTAALDGLLDFAKKHGVKRLVLNGDLIDLPPHPNNQDDPRLIRVPQNWPDDPIADSCDLVDRNRTIVPGSIQDRYMNVLARLVGTPDFHRIGLVGNHDLGVNGLRFILPKRAQANWTPGVLIEVPPSPGGSRRYVYIEHGHRHDPFLWVYTLYALLDILRGDTSSSGGQRGGRIGKAGQSVAPKPMTAEEAGVVGPAKVAAFVKPDTAKSPKEGLGLGQYLTLRSFRSAAYRRFRELKRIGCDISAVMMGHTHLPDRFPLDQRAVYVNIGDWAGNTHHQTYALIMNDGSVVGPAQW